MGKKDGSNDKKNKFDEFKQRLYNNSIIAIVALMVVALPFIESAGKAFRDIKAWLFEPKINLLITIVDEGVVCGPNLVKTGTDLVQRSIIDVGIKNSSDVDVFLTKVRLVPEEITGGFFAGVPGISKTYSVLVDSWYDMVTEAQGYSKKGKAGSDTLVSSGRARKTDDDIWWVKPDPIEVTDIPGDKYTVKKQSEERFRIHMGLKRSINFIIGRIIVEIETDRGDKLKSPSFDIAVCERDDGKGKK